jgi:hypothetical protein
MRQFPPSKVLGLGRSIACWLRLKERFLTLFLHNLYERNCLCMCRNTPQATQGQIQRALLHGPGNELVDLSAQELIRCATARGIE